MSKIKKIIPTHTQIEKIINAYLGALTLNAGQSVEAETEVTYRKGRFYIKAKGGVPIPYRLDEMQDMTVKLWGPPPDPSCIDPTD